MMWSSLGVIALATLLAWWQLPKNPDTLLILHFRPERGIDLYGSLSEVIKLGMFGVGLVLINAFLVRVFSRRERFLSFIIALVTAFLSLLILITIFVIVINNKEPSALFII